MKAERAIFSSKRTPTKVVSHSNLFADNWGRGSLKTLFIKMSFAFYSAKQRIPITERKKVAVPDLAKFGRSEKQHIGLEAAGRKKRENAAIILGLPTY